MERKEFESDISHFAIRDGILFGKYKVSNIDLDVAIRATRERLKFTDLDEFPSFLDFRNVQSTSQEARNYLATDEPAQNLSAVALLVNSPVGRMIGNFYFRINKPPFPFMLFTEKDKALAWLKKYVRDETLV